MTTRANTAPVFVAICRDCGCHLHIYQARGTRAYLFTRCLLCGFSQRPHDVAEQSRLWNLLPEDLRTRLRKPGILAAPAQSVCPCCGKPATA